jgi:hypothetical protein
VYLAKTLANIFIEGYVLSMWYGQLPVRFIFLGTGTSVLVPVQVFAYEGGFGTLIKEQDAEPAENASGRVAQY